MKLKIISIGLILIVFLSFLVSVITQKQDTRDFAAETCDPEGCDSQFACILDDCGTGTRTCNSVKCPRVFDGSKDSRYCDQCESLACIPDVDLVSMWLNDTEIMKNKYFTVDGKIDLTNLKLEIKLKKGKDNLNLKFMQDGKEIGTIEMPKKISSGSITLLNGSEWVIEGEILRVLMPIKYSITTSKNPVTIEMQYY